MAQAAVSWIQHRMLGAMVRLDIAQQLAFDLTPQEATTLSRALAAVHQDYRRIDEIFLSPVASDGYFSGKVNADGVAVALAEGVCFLSWPEVAALAAQLTAEPPS